MRFFSSLFNTSKTEKKQRETLVCESAKGGFFEIQLLEEMEKREKLITEYFQLLDAKKYEQALDAINFAIKSMPDESAFYEQKSFCLMQMKRFDEATKVLDEAIKQFPEEAGAFNEIKFDILQDLEVESNE